MVISVGKTEVGNILHLVEGRETDFALGLHGFVRIDITQVLNSMDISKPVFLHFTRCVAEEDLRDQLAYAVVEGLNYPFYSPTHIFLPESAGGADIGGKSGKDQKFARGKCERCGGDNVELVPKLKPAICYGCAQIDMFLAKKAKPITEDGSKPGTESTDEGSK